MTTTVLERVTFAANYPYSGAVISTQCRDVIIRQVRHSKGYDGWQFEYRPVGCRNYRTYVVWRNPDSMANVWIFEGHVHGLTQDRWAPPQSGATRHKVTSPLWAQDFNVKLAELDLHPLHHFSNTH